VWSAGLSRQTQLAAAAAAWLKLMCGHVVLLCWCVVQCAAVDAEVGQVVSALKGKFFLH
jgi:hypothetical protein